MAQKTIVTTVTVVAGGKDHPPGTEVTLDAAEADRVLARFGGSEVKGTKKGTGAKSDAALVDEAESGDKKPPVGRNGI
jgi:hypothetical protein